ncbi:sulfatase-like hydrolase/transferase [Patescibacteria group bacterium]
MILSKLVPISPLLIVLSPLVFLLSENIESVPLHLVVRPLMFILFIAFVVQYVLHIVIRDRTRATFIAGVILFVSMHYGHAIKYIPHFELIHIQSFVIGKNTFLITFMFMLFFILIRWAMITKRQCFKGLLFLSSLSVALISMNMFRIAYYWFGFTHARAPTHNYSSDSLKKKFINLPDIYYIIVDMHARDDVLEQVYGYKDEYLIPQLSEMGFYVATQSSANYLETYESLASSLNVDYLDTITGLEEQTTSTVISLVEENVVAYTLKELGYTYVLFKSGFAITDKSLLANYTYEYSLGLNRFERLLFNTTILYRFVERMTVEINKYHGQRLLFFFDQLKQIPEDNTPTFTFAHLVTPHWPFVFDADGNSVEQMTHEGLYDYPKSKKEYQRQYLDQLVFTDKKIVEVVNEIITQSDSPPIIIIQSDHGPSSEIDWDNFDTLSESETRYDPSKEISRNERSSILNAYLFPDRNYQNVYSTITPVNTFRVIFNQFFGGKYMLLEDKTIEL